MNTINGLIERVLGKEYISKFSIIIEENKEANDYFKLVSVEDKIQIKASNIISATSGIHYYMKHYLNIHISWCGNQLDIPKTFPIVEEEITNIIPYKYKYYMNYCTYGYSMAFWDWERWETELDFMALNGMNLALSLVGHEEVWRQTLIEFGYTNEEAKAFISGPAFLPWQWMQNIEGYASDYDDSWFEKRVDLANKIHARMNELGIIPAMQGYSGMIPKNFKEKVDNVQTIEQGLWNYLERPDLLLPETDMFQKVAEVFYKKQKDIFNVESNFYCTDPFHEGGKKDGLNVDKCLKIIQDKMVEHDENAIWVIQAWGTNPCDIALEVLDKDHALILDLWCESRPSWKVRNAFNGIPWIYCILGNFGGKNGLYGNLEATGNGHIDALKDKDSGNMVGIGLTMEGIDNNPIVWDLLLDTSLNRDNTDLDKWLSEYIKRRYGKKSKIAEDAFKVLRDNIYNCNVSMQEGGMESIICARPSKDITSISTWGPKEYYYDKSDSARACELLLKEYDNLHQSEAYLYDLVDITRQALADNARVKYDELMNCYEEKDLESFNKLKEEYLQIILDMDALLNTNKHFMVGNYLSQANDLGENDKEKAYLEWNARTIITLWANEEGSKLLRDYSHRQWSGLTKDLYYKRWNIYLQEISRALEEKREEIEIDWYNIENEWATARNIYSVVPTGDVKEIANKIIEKVKLGSEYYVAN